MRAMEYGISRLIQKVKNVIEYTTLKTSQLIYHHCLCYLTLFHRNYRFL